MTGSEVNEGMKTIEASEHLLRQEFTTPSQQADVGFVDLLICPACSHKLQPDEGFYRCQANREHSYPIINGIPILIDERQSTFRLAPYCERNSLHAERPLGQRLRRLVPRISKNLVARNNLARMRQLLLLNEARPSVLVLGGATPGAGMEEILLERRIRCLETDIVVGPRTALVVDANLIPLQPESVDGVVVQAMLEYVPDPARVVSEIFRVLRPGGLVYSEMPFMQDVHGGRYDFTRLTHLGHLRLFRQFEELASGACAGPATALAWALQQFCLAWARLPWQRNAIKVGTGFGLFWLKYFDYYLARTPGGLDGATGTFLLACKGSGVRSDTDLIASYHGAVPATEIL